MERAVPSAWDDAPTPHDAVAASPRGAGDARDDAESQEEPTSVRERSSTADPVSRRPSDPRRLAWWVVASAAAIGLVVLAAALRGPVDATPSRAVPSTPGGAAAHVPFEAALEAIRSDDWAEAVRLLEEASALDPSRGEIARYLEVAKRERGAAADVAEAHRCADLGDAACVERALARVPSDSLASERNAAGIRERLAAVDGGAVVERADPIQEPEGVAPRAGAPVAAKPSGEKVHRSAPIARLQGKRPSHGARPAPDAGRSPEGKRQPPPGGTQDGEGAAAGSAAAARLVQAGVRARVADDLELAAERFAQAAALDPTNAEARAELEAMRARLPEIFRRSYARMEGEPERAARGMKLVARLAPAADPLRAKAEKWLARLPSGSGR